MELKYAPPKQVWNDNTSRALSYLLAHPGHTDMSELLYRVQAELAETGPDGVLLRNVVSGEWSLSASSGQAAVRLTEKLDEVPSALLVHSEAERRAAEARFPALRWEELTLYRFPTLEPPLFPLTFEIWPLDEGDIPDAKRCDPLLEEGALRLQIRRKQVYGACMDDRLTGTVGIAADGGISMLSVTPELRGRGIGSTLLQWMLRRELRSGHIPFLLADSRAPIPMIERAGLCREGTLWRGVPAET